MPREQVGRVVRPCTAAGDRLALDRRRRAEQAFMDATGSRWSPGPREDRGFPGLARQHQVIVPPRRGDASDLRRRRGARRASSPTPVEAPAEGDLVGRSTRWPSTASRPPRRTAGCARPGDLHLGSSRLQQDVGGRRRAGSQPTSTSARGPPPESPGARRRLRYRRPETASTPQGLAARAQGHGRAVGHPDRGCTRMRSREAARPPNFKERSDHPGRLHEARVIYFPAKHADHGQGTASRSGPAP